MAITINDSPNNFTPAYNPMNFTLSSTNVAQSNFKFVCDIYINGSATRTARIKLPPNPTNNYCVVDISTVIQTALTSDPDRSLFIFEKSTNSLLYYQCQFGEEYGPDASVTVYPNLTTHSIKYAFNGSLSHLEFVDYEDTDYLIANSSRKFLTAAPRTLYMTMTDYFQLGFIVSAANNAYFLKVESFDINGNSIATSLLLNDYAALSSWQDRRMRVPAGPAQLNAFTGSISGDNPPVPNNTYKYTLNMANSVSSATSETITVYIIEKCTDRYTPIAFYFLNRFGEYDTFYFDGSNVKNTNIERKTFKKTIGSWSGTSFVYNKSDRNIVDYMTVSRDTYTITSGWINEDYSEWLLDLLNSPDVFYYDSSNYLIPVNIISSTYETKTEVRDKLFNFEIQYKISNDLVRQRR